MSRKNNANILLIIGCIDDPNQWHFQLRERRKSFRSCLKFYLSDHYFQPFPLPVQFYFKSEITVLDKIASSFATNTNNLINDGGNARSNLTFQVFVQIFFKTRQEKTREGIVLESKKSESCFKNIKKKLPYYRMAGNFEGWEHGPSFLLIKSHG